MTNKRKMVWNREEISKLATNALVERASGFLEFDADVFAHLIAAAVREEISEWRGLTDEEIDRVTDAQWAGNNHAPIYAAYRAYARAIEQALKEKNKNGK
jgi:hypothetical protein